MNSCCRKSPSRSAPSSPGQQGQTWTAATWPSGRFDRPKLSRQCLGGQDHFACGPEALLAAASPSRRPPVKPGASPMHAAQPPRSCAASDSSPDQKRPHQVNANFTVWLGSRFLSYQLLRIYYPAISFPRAQPSDSRQTAMHDGNSRQQGVSHIYVQTMQKPPNLP